MAKDVKVELNHDGFKQFLTSSSVESLVLSEAQRIANTANRSINEASTGYVAHSRKASSRYIAFVGTTDGASIQAESENKALSGAVIPHG